MHTGVVSAAVASSSTSPTSPRMSRRRTSQGSFHAGAPIPQLTPYDEPSGGRRPSLGFRRASSHQYHTFPTAPPKTPSQQSKPPDFSDSLRREHDDGSDASDTSSVGGGEDREQDIAPLPWRQLGLLALLSLCEQTALNSIGPYLPSMVASFDEIPESQVGLYVGLLASAFALAQLATNFLWGYLSDTVGRKPVMLVGTSLLSGCFVFFGFCRNFPELIAVHMAMGLLNGNAAVVPRALERSPTGRTRAERSPGCL